MPNINLIAERREEKKRWERITRQLFFGLAASVTAFVLMTLFMTAERLNRGSVLNETEAKMQKLQPKLEQIARIKKETGELTPKVETLQAARTNTQRWRAVMQVVSQAVPENTWLSGMSATGVGGDDTTINLVGITNTQTHVGETMTNLGSHPLFDRVELRYTQASVPAGGPPGDTTGQRVQFEIGAHLRGAPKKEEKPAATGEAKAALAPAAATGGKNNG